jgi:hypothetical protein
MDIKIRSITLLELEARVNMENTALFMQGAFNFFASTQFFFAIISWSRLILASLVNHFPLTLL